jgi:arylsulfatase
MHCRTNLSPECDRVTGYGLDADGMKERDHDVRVLFDLLDDLGVAENTLVMFSADNGATPNSWPDGGNHPFRGERRPLAADGGLRLHRDDLPRAALR